MIPVGLGPWALRHHVSMEALTELAAMLGVTTAPPAAVAPGGEARVQGQLRLDAAKSGMLLFRNNVGVLEDRTGRPVRYGLANDSTALNKQFKSGDLIGGRPVVITPAHVGQTLLQLVSYECKAPGWSYTGTDREEAQQRWAQLITVNGGYAKFTTGDL